MIKLNKTIITQLISSLSKYNRKQPTAIDMYNNISLKFEEKTDKQKHKINAERMQIPLTIIHLLEFDFGFWNIVDCWLLVVY